MKLYKKRNRCEQKAPPKPIEGEFLCEIVRTKAMQAQSQTAKTHSTYQTFDRNLSLDIDVMVSSEPAEK